MEIRDRNLLYALLRAEFDRARRHKLNLSCIMLCVRNPKEILQEHGSDFLESAVQLLTEMVRSSDIIASYNKEKFLIVLPMVNAESSTFAAQRINRVFTHLPLSKGPDPVKPTLSIGIASISDKGVNSPEDLIRCAETALNKADSGGKEALCLWRDLTQQP